MAQRFADHVVFITGASSGIGAACAKEFARQGARVVLTARRTEKLEHVQSQITAAGGTALAVPCDVTDRASIDAAVVHAVDALGKIDVVLANAGFGVTGPITRLETEDFRRQFATNVFGVIDTVCATLSHLLESNGRLGIVSSVSSRMGTPQTPPYAASKFAVVGLAECLYYDLAPKHVAVTCINPGFIASDIRNINNHGQHTGKPDPVPQFLVMPAEKAARQIVRAIYKRKPEVVITRHGKAAVFLARHCPRLLRTALRLGSKRSAA